MKGCCDVFLRDRGLDPPTSDERLRVFDAVRADARVPKGALLLLDIRGVDGGMSEYAVAERLRVLVDLLGPQLGPVCAMIVSPPVADQAAMFQAKGIGVGLRVGLFNDEPSARQWLAQC